MREIVLSIVHSHLKRCIYNTLLLKGRSMEEEFSRAESSKAGRATKNGVHPSVDKSLRTMLLAVLFQVAWPTRLTLQQIIDQLPLYGDSPKRALYRDIGTLTDTYVRDLPEPGDANIAEWCTEQQRLNRLAISYDR